MADRILTFQQSSVMQDIESYLDLAKRGAHWEVLQEILEGILLLVEDDADLYPPELDPETFFKDRVDYDSDAYRPMIKLYLHRVHKHLDARNRRGLAR